nr:hypothetical protein 1 [bacterium]
MKLRNIGVYGIILIFFVFFVISAMAGEFDRKIMCISGVDGENTVYVGTDMGLFVSENGGIDWAKISFSEGVVSVKDILVHEDKIFLATDIGIYIYKDKKWRRVAGKKKMKGVKLVSSGKGEEDIFAYTDKEIFRIEKGDLQLVDGGALWGRIDDLECKEGIIYLASGQNLFYSANKGISWDKRALIMSEGVEETGVFEDEEYIFSPMIGNIDTGFPGGVTVATRKGIFHIVVNNGQLEVKRIDTTGLPAEGVKYALSEGAQLFAATASRVFLFGGDSAGWRTVFMPDKPGTISLMEVHKGSGGKELLAACGKWFYACELDSLVSGRYMENFYAGNGGGPSILEVHKMAIEYAEVSPEKIKAWRKAAGWRAVMPKVSLNYSESMDDNIEIYKNSTKYYVVEGPRERDNDWGIDLSWDLADLVWNDAQTSIDVRSKLMVQLALSLTHM